MTLLSDWPVTLSSLGEASISLPQQIIRRLASLGESQRPSNSLSPFFADLLSSNPSASALTALSLCLTVVAGLLLAVATMSWRDKFNFFQRSPSYGGSSSHHHNTSATPQVNDSDYSYLTENDIVEPPRSHHQQQQAQYIRQHAQMDDSGPDIIVLKHRGVIYPLLFSPYVIDDGLLTVGEIRRRAAEQVGTSEVQRIKILYKGKLLRDDSIPCKDEGLKQQSEIMCVLSEVRPGESSSDLSDSEMGNRSESVVSLDSGSNDHHHKTQSGSGVGGRRKKNNKKKKKKQPQQPPAAAAATASNLAPPSDARPTSSGRSSAAPSPAPSLQQFSTGNEQVDALLRYLRTELAPSCDQYISQPPTDPKVREFEHKRLEEMILTQVIIKADSIESEDARMARRALIKEAQGMLNRLDAVAPKDKS